MEVLESLCKASDQKINFRKSLMFVSPNISEHDAARLSANMGIPLTSKMGCYMGHQLVHRGRNSNSHNRLLQRVKVKLDRWKAKCLSRACRITLAQSVLG